jgi:hypothetical protein
VLFGVDDHVLDGATAAVGAQLPGHDLPLCLQGADDLPNARIRRSRRIGHESLHER